VINQYHKNIGRKVKIVHFEHGSSEGTLKEVSDEAITIEWEEKERLEGKKKKIKVIKEKIINYKEIKETKLILSFK
jgi:ribosome maturation factor RimP